MKQITLRNVPEELHKELKVAAVHADVPLQALVVEILANDKARGEALKHLESDRGN